MGIGHAGLRPVVSKSGFTLIELLIVVVIIGILASIALPRFGEARAQAHLTTISSDLRHLSQAQERYFAVALEYSTSLEDLDFKTSVGVEIDVEAASTTGWSASGRHQALPGAQGCVVFLGDADSPDLPNGDPGPLAPGQVFCSR